MSVKRLPSAQVALASLRENGNQFQTVPLVPEPMEGVTYLHAKKGVRAVEADPRVLAATGQFYVANEMLRRAIHQKGGRVESLQSGVSFIKQAYAQRRVVWGVSGFASIGYPCNVQADQLAVFYDYLASQHRDAIVCDGAAGAGVLGISGVMAEARGITTLGVTPLQGMSTMAPRTHMLVYGDTYQQREVIVGLLPDILVIVGGGPGAEREGVATLKSGGRVLLLDDPDNSSIPWRAVPEMMQAVGEKRMLVRGQLDEIVGAASELHAVAARAVRGLRPARFTELRRRFAA